MNALELTNAVLQEMKSPTAASLTVAFGDQLRALAWVNRAIQDIATKPVEWKFSRVRNNTFSTVVGQREYTSSGLSLANLDKFDLFSFRIGTKVLARCSYEDIASLDWAGQPAAVCSPEYNTIAFSHFPTAIETVTYDYFRTHPTLSVNADTPLIPEKFHYLIVCLALMHYATFDDAPEIYSAKSMDAARLYKQLYREQSIVRSGTVL